MSGFSSTSIDYPCYLIDSSRDLPGNDVVVAGGQTTNYPSTGGKRLAPGTVVVLESGDGMYYLADGADGASAGDINTTAVVDSAEAPDADWDLKVLTWTVYYPDGRVATGTVTGGAADDTVGEWVTLLNADASFRNHLVASAATILRITSLSKGRITVKISMNLTTAYGTISGSSSYTSASGTEADYRVVTAHRDLVDTDGASFNSHPVPTLKAGRFDESEMRNLSAEAKAVLLGRGSSFE